MDENDIRLRTGITGGGPVGTSILRPVGALFRAVDES